MQMHKVQVQTAFEIIVGSTGINEEFITKSKNLKSCRHGDHFMTVVDINCF